MTWNDLIEQLAKLTPEQRQTDIAVCLDMGGKEFFSGCDATLLVTDEDENDILDGNHPFTSIP